MTHARFAPPGTAAEQTILLDQLNATLNWYWRKRSATYGSPDPLDTWARHAFGAYEERNKHKTLFHHAFLSLAAKFGLSEYLRQKIRNGDDFGYQAGIPLLSHVLEFLVSRRQTVYPLSSPEVVRAILESGEDPNLDYKSIYAEEETPRPLAMKCVREGKRRGWIRPFDVDMNGTSRWAHILQTLLDLNATPAATMPKDAWDPECKVLNIIDSVAEADFPAVVWDLKARMQEVI